MTGYVRVMFLLGDAAFSGCTADQFEPDVLTITNLSTNEVVTTYRSGAWESCTVYGLDGYYEHHFMSAQLRARALAAAESFKTRNAVCQ